jgi:DNA polymerase-3 subunit beta
MVLNRKILLDALKYASNFVPKKTTIPSLLNFKLIFDKDKLTIISTDLDNWMKVYVSIVNQDIVTILINAKNFINIVEKISSDEIYLNIVNDCLKIVADNMEFKITVIFGSLIDKYPNFQDQEFTKDTTISTEDFNDMVKCSSFAASKYDMEVLKHILLRISSKQVGMVATDGHMLGMCYKEYKGNSDVDLIVNPNFLNACTKIFKSGFDNKLSESMCVCHISHVCKEVDLKKIPSWICIEYNLSENIFVLLYSKLGEGPYPEYEKVIPQNKDKKVIVSRYSLLDALKQLLPFSNENTNLIKFKYTCNNLELYIKNIDIGCDVNKNLNVEYSGEDFIIGFNGKYFIKELEILDCDVVIITMGTVLGPCLIFDNSCEGKLLLIMPLRIIEEDGE